MSNEVRIVANAEEWSAHLRGLLRTAKAHRPGTLRSRAHWLRIGRLGIAFHWERRY